MIKNFGFWLDAVIMRLSATQKDILFTLFAIEKAGKSGPVPATRLLSLINGSRFIEVHGNNFRTSCHTSVSYGLLHKYRHPSDLTLAFSLTEEGRAIAERLYQTRITLPD